MTPEQHKNVEEAKASLTRIQDFDARSIGRREKLGDDLNFEDGIAPLERTLSLFREVSSDVLSDMSQQRRDVVKQWADALYNLVDEIRNFSVASGNPKQTRDNLIQQLNDGYDNYFEQLWPVIAYSVRRATDFSRMEREARAAIQSIDDRTKDLESGLMVRQIEAESALEAIRKVAAEQGVSQQAIYFKDEADFHNKEADKWFKWTKWLTVGLAIFAASTLFLHKISWLRPKDSAEAIQFAIGKMLVFATVAYFLILVARNYSKRCTNPVLT